MDMEKLAAMVSQKHGVRFDMHDPVFVLVTLIEEMQRQCTAEIAKTVTEAADQISATVAQLEDGTRKRAEATVGAAAGWGAAQIRAAGEAASVALQETIQQDILRVERAKTVTVIAAIVTVTATCMMVMLWGGPLVSRILG